MFWPGGRCGELANREKRESGEKGKGLHDLLEVIDEDQWGYLDAAPLVTVRKG